MVEARAGLREGRHVLGWVTGVVLAAYAGISPHGSFAVEDLMRLEASTRTGTALILSRDWLSYNQLAR